MVTEKERLDEYIKEHSKLVKSHAKEADRIEKRMDKLQKDIDEMMHKHDKENEELRKKYLGTDLHEVLVCGK